MKHARIVLRRLVAAGAAIALWAVAPHTVRAADPMPVLMAVFDFELDDFSAGAGIAGDAAADAEQLHKAGDETRRLLAESGRYALVKVADTGDEAVTGRRLRQCSGCEAAVAKRLGAAQSLLGTVTRISRTEYMVRFQVRDAGTGDVLLARQSDLQLGANYSWPRAAASLIRKGLLSDR